ncbi:MAG: chorismate mutase [Clostridia bacterium]|nr:chorismate mutase [Clostridia bacterium]
MSLEELREQIDTIDTQLIDLFKQRLAVAADVAAYKKEHDLPVLDRARERALLNDRAQKAGESFESETRILFHTVMGVSRAYQNKLLGAKSSYADAIAQAVVSTEQVFPENAFVACQGVEGAYSQLACEKIFMNPMIMFMNTWEGVFQAVENGLCRYGILPLENSNAGSVNRIYDLLAQYRFSIVRSTRLQINHCLLAKKNTKWEDVREIYSHEQAIRQCSELLDSLKNVKVHVCENTALAAKMVAESDRNDVAALSSKQCAELYHLSVLREAVQNAGNNYTRFICVSKKLEIYPGANKTSLMIVVPHRPGALYHVLSEFNCLGVNVIKLESRPIPGRDFEFMFYFDIDVSVYSPKFGVLLGELENEAEQFQYLGSYSEVT